MGRLIPFYVYNNNLYPKSLFLNVLWKADLARHDHLSKSSQIWLIVFGSLVEAGLVSPSKDMWNQTLWAQIIVLHIKRHQKIHRLDEGILEPI